MAVESVDDYVRGLEDWRADLVSVLRKMIKKTVPEASESIKWGRPFYDREGPLCYVVAHSKSVNLGFWRGAELEDSQGLLEGTGEKMRHIKLDDVGQIPEEAIRTLLQQAESLNLG